MMPLVLRELTTIEEMLANIEVMRFLYPTFTLEKYESYLKEMIPHNYKQVAVFENEICVAVSGFWSGTKLWSGKYIEIDNFIVHPDHRSKGLGKMMTDYVDALGQRNRLYYDCFRCLYRKLHGTPFLLQPRICSKRISFLENIKRRGT